MIIHETKIRVLYADTDKMGFVYYGNYAKYYEFGRTEAIRSLGISYNEMEKLGVGMPVANMNITYKRPAYYDDLLTVKTIIKEMPKARMNFIYEVYNENNNLINIGETTLIFLDIKHNRPTRIPEYLSNKIAPYFE